MFHFGRGYWLLKIRVLPCAIAGGAVTGALVALFKCELVTPHGGVMVLIIPNAMNYPLKYLLAIAIGSVVTGVAYAVIKRLNKPYRSFDLAINEYYVNPILDQLESLLEFVQVIGS